MELGANFDTNDEGELVWGRAAGHSRRRILHSDGDATGAEVMRALNDAVASTPTVESIDGRTSGAREV